MTRWENFFFDKTRKIFNEKNDIIDIGGGLRILQDRGNRYDPKNAWITELAKKVSYRIMDPVPDYKPDIIGDIHAMPFADSSIDAIFCIAVLEHVEDPFTACRELYRTLKPGGYCLVYVPFIYYYHAESGYYHDYWRFSHDAVSLLFKAFQSREFMPVRGPYETMLRFTPLDRFSVVRRCIRWMDVRFKPASKQVSGYYIFSTK